MDDWDFREQQHDGDTYDPAGVGRWGKTKNAPNENKENTMTTVSTEKKKMGPTDVVTPEFRASYLNAFDAKAPDPEKPNEKIFGVEMWFRVTHTPESQQAGEKLVKIDDLIKAATAAGTEKWGPDQSKWPTFKHKLFKKGEENQGKQGPVPGVIIVRTNRKEEWGRPAMVDQNLKDIIDKKQAYSGCYMRAKIHAHAWTHPRGGAGISFTLDMLQLVRDGEPLGSSIQPADAFESIPVPEGAAGQAAPAAAAAGGMFGNLG